jgi:hypothetical protein
VRLTRARYLPASIVEFRTGAARCHRGGGKSAGFGSAETCVARHVGKSAMRRATSLR